MLQHKHYLRIRYSETDQMGNYYNSRALEWFEVARTELCRATGIPYTEWERRGVMLPLVEAHVEYQGPTRYDDRLKLSVAVSMPRRARVRFDVEVEQAESGAAVCRGYTVHAITDNTGRPIRPPDWLRELLQGPQPPAIIDADVDDAEALLALQRLAYRREAELHDDFMIPPLTQTLEEIQDSFGTHVFLKAEAEGVAVGSVRARQDHGTCNIGRLIVHPGHQRRGIGTRLMEAIEDRFRDACRFELFTGHKSTDNVRLYERLGYTEFKRETASPRVTLIFMEKVNAQRRSG